MPDQYSYLHDKEIVGNCKYCSSISPIVALSLLKTPGTKYSGPDYENNYPSVFYLNNQRFNSVHLSNLDDNAFKEITELLNKFFRIEFTKDENGIKFKRVKLKTGS